jgi:uncharacterized protein YbjT (DUF2867 family)
MTDVPPYRAVVLGATGAVGGALVRELLASPRCTTVTALVRRSVGVFDGLAGREKLRLELIDLRDIERATSRLPGGADVAFCTMGIGQPRKVPYEEFVRVDVEYTGAFARGAAAAGVRHISLLSSVGADRASRTRYLRVKGAAEQAVIDAKVPRTSLFRPSLLVTAQIRYGLQDRLTQTLFPVLSPLFASRYHEIRVEELARAMRANAERPGSSAVEVLYYEDCRAVLRATSQAGAGA